MTEQSDNYDEGFKQKKKNGSNTNSGGFQSLGLSESVYRGIVKIGFRIPTPVQRKSLPIILSGSDTVVMARTGSGKTAAFCIPLLERLLNSTQRRNKTQHQATTSLSAGAVILSPTRELSLQTLRVLKTLSSCISDPPIKCIGINGGESMEKQFSLLSSNPDVIVATPGRLAHHLNEIPDFHLRHCDLVVFDEADRLFEMGFALQIRQICKAMPSCESGRQTLLFSATMPKVLIEFTKSGIMDMDPQVVRLDKDATVSDELRIGFICVRSGEKDGALLHLLRDVLPMSQASSSLDTQENNSKQQKSKSQGKGKKSQANDKLQLRHLGLTLIFAATRHHVDYLTTLINNAGLGHSQSKNQTIATCIYGTMDQEARKINLASFRSGATPILVVTDVAARGIDVPLIDHVIHYSFPPSAKLFVHRSGRAARAGRIGYCWGIVDVEEMPYMVDLYLFLGRKLSTGRGRINDNSQNEDEEDTSHEPNSECRSEEDEIEKIQSSTGVLIDSQDEYAINEMTPQMVHFGALPESIMTEEVENVRRIIESEITGSHDADMLRSLSRVCDNAMKQYRRSRPEASREGIRRAKAILEGVKEQSGKRVGGGMIPVHPVLRGVERQRLMNIQSEDGMSKNVTKESVDAKLKEMKQREEFLRAMSNFRPKETIFETFATGGGKVSSVVSHIDKGKTTISISSKKNDSSFAFSAMKNMRRQMKLAHDKGSSLVVAGSNSALIMNGELSQDNTLEQSSDLQPEIAIQESKPILNTDKRRISKAERKRSKKNGNSIITSLPITTPGEKKAKDKSGTDFRDQAYYIDNEIVHDTAEAQRSRHIEAAMQPSASSNTKDSMSSALRLEEAMLDIVGDENIDLVQKHRLMRWDKSKRKYIQTTLGSELSGESKSKRLKLESGQIVKSDKIKLGELYEKWQKKTNKSIGRVGVFDDVTSNAEDNIDNVQIGSSSKGKGGKGKSNTNQNKGTDTIKTVAQIRKEREAEKQKKLKNMKRSDRRKLEQKKRTDTNTKMSEMGKKGKGWQGKKGFSGRYGAVIKGRK